MFLQTIVLLSKIKYIEEIRINYCEYLKFVKQKIINKANKLRQVVKIISRVLNIQYKKETINKDIKTTNKTIIVAKTTIRKTNKEIVKYIELETQINILIQENKE